MTADFDALAAEYNAALERARAEIDPRWRITGYRGHETRNGVSFAATLRYDGSTVADVEQDGNGGDTRLYFRDPFYRTAWEAECARVAPDHFQDMVVEALLLRAGF